MVVMIVMVSQVFFALPAITTRSDAVACLIITIMMMIDDDGDHVSVQQVPMVRYCQRKLRCTVQG